MSVTQTDFLERIAALPYIFLVFLAFSIVCRRDIVVNKPSSLYLAFALHFILYAAETDNGYL